MKAASASALTGLSLVLGLICAIGGAQGIFVVEEASLVLLNTSLPEFAISLATFGVPQYGRDVTGLLEYSSNPTGQLECEFIKERFPTHKQPFILLMDRGGCKFTVKALHAQQAGAIAAVMVDDRVEGADNSLITMDSGADDQSQLEAANVTIPIALIREDDGLILKTMLRKAKAGGLPASLDYKRVLKRQTTQVPWGLWLTSDDSCGVRCQNQLRLLADVRAAADSMVAENRVAFNVHYPVFPCPALARNCARRCTNGGRYCAQSPLDKGVESTVYGGRDVVTQNLRSVCVFDQASAAKRLSMWWAFAAASTNKCSFARKTYSDACAQKQAAAGGANLTALRLCMGSTADGAANARLEAEYQEVSADTPRGDIVELLLPAVTAQGVQYRGNIVAAPVVQFVCAGFCAASAPAACPRGLAARPCPAGGKPASDYATDSSSSSSSDSDDSSSSSSDSDSATDAQSSTGAASSPPSSSSSTATTTSTGTTAGAGNGTDTDTDTGSSTTREEPPTSDSTTSSGSAQGPPPVQPPAPTSPPPPLPPLPAPPPAAKAGGKGEEESGGGGAAAGVILGLLGVGALGGGGFWYYKNKWLPQQGKGGAGPYQVIEMS